MFYIPTNYPDILLSNQNNNPILHSPNSDYSISFAMTKDGSYDLEEYKLFLDSAIREFRHSRTYTHYKAYLYSLGLNCCQFHPYIMSGKDFEVASLEMHHCMLNIYQIAVLISDHLLNTYGTLTEFDLAEILRYEHVNNRIPIVMLCKTCHQQYHHKYLYVHPNMVFGKWWELIERYPSGLKDNKDIANSLIMYLSKAINEDEVKTQERKAKYLLQLRDNIMKWSEV